VRPGTVAVSDRCAGARRLSTRDVVQVGHDDSPTSVNQQKVRLFEVGNECLSTIVSLAKTAEPIEIPFGLWTRVG